MQRVVSKVDRTNGKPVTSNRYCWRSPRIPALSQLLFFTGAIPGMLVFGWLADRHGRLPTIFLSNTICLVCGVVTPFTTGHTAFLALRFLMGTAFNTFYTSPYILVLEYVDISKRTLVGNLGLALFLTLSGVYQPWAVQALGHWRTFNWAIFGQMGLIVLIPFLLPESCRWLMSRGRTEQVLAILRRIARLNGRQVADSVYEAAERLCQVQTRFGVADGISTLLKPARPQLSYLDLFRQPDMRRISLLVFLLWMVISCVFDTTVRNIENLQYDIYFSFMVAAAMELPADLLSIVGLNWLGRRWSASLSLLLCGGTMAVVPWLTAGTTAATVLFMVARFFATYAMNVGFQICVEVMPTELRGQGTAMANGMSMLSQMASPYIVYSAVLSEKAPYLIIACLSILGSLPGLFLPETAGVKMPDTLEDIKQFGKKDRFFWMPLCGSESRLKQQGQAVHLEKNPTENLAFSDL